MRFTALVFALALPFTFAAAQTLTATDPDSGDVVVEDVTVDVNGNPTTVTLMTVAETITTVDPAGDTVVEYLTGDGQGVTVTQILQTLPAANPAGQGPVGQPGTTGAAGAPTPFTYTTTNADGETRQVVATFTPSFAPTVVPSLTFQATVLDYSAYTASYGTAQQAAAQNSALRNGGWWGLGLSGLISVAGGAYMLLGA
ncbi:Protein kinase domain-containing protein [Mycena sanguinolenta]|uniref:Protein kinase domain-containing protein n=1 Tax=Mycena sanguinolenta TaxID=230812 RepID=A0A8H7DJA3_9AGAR|nr:Protein kinase domain-containing protein [Mycena sanguinolenta]